MTGAGMRSMNRRSLPYAPACTCVDPNSAVNISINEMIPHVETAMFAVFNVSVSE
jgi:hypothetical protein